MCVDPPGEFELGPCGLTGVGPDQLETAKRVLLNNFDLVLISVRLLVVTGETNQPNDTLPRPLPLRRNGYLLGPKWPFSRINYASRVTELEALR
jgi:hypothetical protein